MVEELVADLLDEAQERGSFDFVADFAARIPIAFITRIVGLPLEDGDLLRRIGLQVLFPLNPKVTPEAVAAGDAASAEFRSYVLGHADHIRRRGTGGEPASVLEALVIAQDAGTISESELVHLCLLVFNGGHETTTNLIAVAVKALLDHPRQFAELGEDPEGLLATAVEECVRYVSPLQLQGRRTTQEITIANGTLPEGAEVILCQASANRDERQFENPDTLDLRRRPNGHVAIGHGVHVCIGRPLARMEAAIVLPRVARRFPDLQPTGDAVWNPNVRFRGLRSLPVAVA
jgi:cytochrome P450